MAVQKVVTYGHSALRAISQNITDFSNIKSLIDDLFDTMYECLQFGYGESSKKLAEIGPETVNKIHAHIKFYCYEITET